MFHHPTLDLKLPLRNGWKYFSGEEGVEEDVGMEVACACDIIQVSATSWCHSTDYLNIPGRSKYFHDKIRDVLKTGIKISFYYKELFPYFLRQILTNWSGHIGANSYFHIWPPWSGHKFSKNEKFRSIQISWPLSLSIYWNYQRT